MADVDPGMEQAIPQQPPLPGMAQPNGAGQHEPDQGADADALDPKVLKSELDKVKKQLGTTINDLARHKKLIKRQEEVDALAERAKAWIDVQEELGVEPAQIREQHKAREDNELGEAKNKGDVEKLLANRDQKHQRDLAKIGDQVKERETKIAQMQSVIDRITIDRVLQDELSKICDPLLIKGAFALHRPKAKAVPDDEAPYGIRVVMDVDGDDMEPKDFFKAWAEADPEAQPYLIGNRSQGGGAPPGGRTGGPRMQRGKMSPKQKSDYMTQYGIEAYNKLPM